MSSDLIKETENFDKLVDFLRYGLSLANQASQYYGHGTDNAWDDIRSLILRSLSLPYDLDHELIFSSLCPREKAHLCQQLDKRINQRIPVPYLIKEAYFCSLLFYVDERVLIPRSPIAELITHQFSPWIEADKVSRVLDLCTGGGSIAIACCYAFPDAVVDAVDISKDALDVAAINAERLEVLEQLTLIESDCFSKLPNKKYDIIVSNPPYVGEEEMKTLPKEYQYEPTLALKANKNGLEIVEKILMNAHAYLNDGGILVVEVGNSEEALCEAYPFVDFTWLEMEQGGSGIFLLQKEQLQAFIK